MRGHGRRWKAALGFAVAVVAARWIYWLYRRGEIRSPAEATAPPEPAPSRLAADLRPCPALPLLPNETFSRPQATSCLPAHPLVAPGSTSPRDLRAGIPWRMVAPRRRQEECAGPVLEPEEAPIGEGRAGRGETMSSDRSDLQQAPGQTPVLAELGPRPSPAPRILRAALALILLPFLHRRLRLATAAIILLTLGWSFQPARGALHSAIAVAGQPLRDRAAFDWDETFDDGFTAWIHASSLSPAKSGAVLVRGLALHAKTMALKAYEINFSARADKKSIGWVVRASSPGEYYAFKLIERGRSAQGVRFELVRYPVIGGVASERRSVPLIVIGRADAFLNMTVRVGEEQILTLVNGFGVDICKDQKLKSSGGFGFLAEGGESFLVKSLTISGNDDSLGLFLRGAEQTFRALSSQLSGMKLQRVDQG